MQIVTKRTMLREIVAVILSAVMAFFGVTPGIAEAQAPGSVTRTPAVPMELPIEVEIELSPAGSLKQAATWKELYQLLKNPNAFSCPPDDPATPDNESYYCTATIPRRPGFGAAMPPLKIFSPGYNFLTAQPLRRRTSDGEVSWDQPGPLFDTEEEVATDAFSTPTQLRTPIGHLVACPNVAPGYQAAAIPSSFCRNRPRRQPRRLQPERQPEHSAQPDGRRGRGVRQRRASRRRWRARSRSSRRPSTRRTSSGGGAPRSWGWCPRRCVPTSAGWGPRCSARRSSGTCRWEATACSPAARATSTPASTADRATSSTRTSTAIPADNELADRVVRHDQRGGERQRLPLPQGRPGRPDDDPTTSCPRWASAASSSSSTSLRSASRTSSPP